MHVVVPALVETVGRTHELVDEAAEDLRRTVGAVVWLGQHLLQNVRNPTVAGGAVVLIVRLQLLEELRDVHAGAVREVLRLLLVLRVIAAKVAHDE